MFPSFQEDPLFVVIRWASRAIFLLFVLSFLYFLLGCSTKNKPKPAVQTNLAGSLADKYAMYLNLTPSKQDAHGFILSDECDSTLFTGLLGTLKEFDVDLTKAQNQDTGQWFRRPTTGVDPCYPDHSKSSISKDMFVGILWYAWKTNNLSILRGIWQYGKSHDWYMGQGDISRVYFVPALQSTLAKMIYALGGEDHPIRVLNFSVSDITGLENLAEYGRPVGFAAHLEVLMVTLLAEVEGGLRDGSLEILKYHAERQPKNALFLYAYIKYTTGDYTEAINILLQDSLFPSDRLPTCADHKEPWIWQRDYGADWQPSVCDKVHPGGDFLFVANLILQEY